MRSFTTALLTGLLAAAPALAEDEVTKEEVEADVASLMRGDVEEALRRNMNRFRYCYQKSFAQDPSIEGKITLRFVVGADGAVISARADSSELPDEVVECMLWVVEEAEFPPPENGGMIIVRYPFVFSAG